MSAPESAVSYSLRNPTRGYSEIPNSLIENQATLTRAELSLSLIVLRRGGGAAPVPVSDKNWQSWTGLGPRQKEYAVKGLRDKTFLDMRGRGDTAVYGFDHRKWENFISSSPREAPKPRTVGRAVSPKVGAKVHPVCRASGCAMLNCEPGEQPVAQTVTGAGRDGKPLTLVFTTQLTQPVAQVVHDSAEFVWAKTLECLRSVFPLVGVTFLLRLLAVVRAAFCDVTDAELARAVRAAWLEKRRVQTSEGLFLLTVPDSLRALRRTGSAFVAPDTSPPARDVGKMARDLLTQCAAVLASKGTAFSECLAVVRRLEAGAGWDIDLLAFDESMLGAETLIAEAAADEMDDTQRAAVDLAVHDRLKGYTDPKRRTGPMDGPQLEKLRADFYRQAVFSVLSIPRLGMVYA